MCGGGDDFESAKFRRLGDGKRVMAEGRCWAASFEFCVEGVAADDPPAGGSQLGPVIGTGVGGSV